MCLIQCIIAHHDSQVSSACHLIIQASLAYFYSVRGIISSSSYPFSNHSPKFPKNHAAARIRRTQWGPVSRIIIYTRIVLPASLQDVLKSPRLY